MLILIFSVEEDSVTKFTPRRKISFNDIFPIPHRERSSKPRKKTFETHLLTHAKTQMIIQKSEIISEKKEEKKIKKEEKIKRILAEEKQKEKEAN